MKISAQFGFWSSLVFAAFAFAFALNGFFQLDAMTDEAARSDARGFAFFWMFLGAVSLACALAAWWIIRRENVNPSD